MSIDTMQSTNLVERITTEKTDNLNDDYFDDSKFFEIYNSINLHNITMKLSLFKDKKLTKEQIKFLFEKYDEDKLNNIDKNNSIARTMLICCMNGLVRKVMSLYNFSLSDDDSFSCGLIGLIRAVDSFDINSNVAFSTFAIPCIKNQIYNQYKSHYYKMKDRNGEAIKVISFDRSTINKFGRECFLDSMIADDFNFVEDLINKDSLNQMTKWFKYLSPLQQICMHYYFGIDIEQLNLTEFAKLINVTRSWTSLLYNKAIKKLRYCMDNQGHKINLKEYKVLTTEEILNYVNNRQNNILE